MKKISILVVTLALLTVITTSAFAISNQERKAAATPQQTTNQITTKSSTLATSNQATSNQTTQVTTQITPTNNNESTEPITYRNDCSQYNSQNNCQTICQNNCAECTSQANCQNKYKNTTKNLIDENNDGICDNKTVSSKNSYKHFNNKCVNQ